MPTPIVIIESPYAAKDAKIAVRNRNYCITCMQDSIFRGEVPFAGHLLYTSVLNDRDPRARALGLRLSRSFLFLSSLVAVYTDYGISAGMKLGIELAERYSIPIEYRRISES